MMYQNTIMTPEVPALIKQSCVSKMDAHRAKSAKELQKKTVTVIYKAIETLI